MTDLQRRLLAGKAGLLELALLRETQRRLVEEAVRQHRLESSNEEQRSNSKHLRFQVFLISQPFESEFFDILNFSVLKIRNP